MNTKILLAAALTLGLGTGAMAQTSPGTPGGTVGTDGSQPGAAATPGAPGGANTGGMQPGGSMQPNVGATGMGTAGQSSVTTGALAGGGMTFDTWDPAVQDVFFSDRTAWTLRTEPEVRQNWASLTEAQRGIVVQECQTLDAPRVDTTPGQRVDEYHQSFGQICEWVNAF